MNNELEEKSKQKNVYDFYYMHIDREGINIYKKNIIQQTIKYLDSRLDRKRFIYRNLYYTKEFKTDFLYLYNRYGHALFKGIFEPVDNSLEDNYFYFENQCGKCNQYYIFKTLSSETYIKMLKYNYEEQNLSQFDIDNKLICEHCIKEIQETKEKERQYYIDNKNLIVSQNTDLFIKTYCNPLADYIKSKTPYQGWNAMCELYYNSNVELLIPYIKKLKYKDFLNTNYWKKIKEYKKYRSNYSCELCSVQNNLHVHHKTYKNHGHEIYREVIYNDLVVLCEDCHHKFHDTLHKEEDNG